MRRRFTILSLVIPVLVGITIDAPDAWAEVVAGNGVYDVHIEDNEFADGIGTYTITTGADHSAGSGLNVLYGDGDAWTSSTTVRSYTSGTEYVQTSSVPFSSPGFTVERLDPYAAISPIGTTGYRTAYALPGAGTAPDAIEITSDVNVNGTAEADSTVEVTTTVLNTGLTPVDIGIRYQWDFQIGPDDGPTFQAENPAGAVLTGEADFPQPGFESYGIADNDGPTPAFKVHGTVNGPASVTPTPTPPERLAYACWPDSFDTAFDYAVVPGRDVTGGDSDCPDDSNVLYYWGETADSAITLAPGASHTVSQSLFLTGGPIPTTLELNPAVADVLSPGTQTYVELSGTLTETTSGDPVAGVDVRFENDGVVGTLGPFDCTGTTDANGFASCGGTTHTADAVALGFEYCATSAATSTHRHASDCGPIARVLGVPLF